MKKLIKKNYFEHLILETCLQFGQQTHYQKHKFNQYVFISRHKREILSLYEMRLMFFKLYPLIHGLYSSNTKNINLQKILFATTTTKYKTIIKEAAIFCSMPFHINRWTNGFISKNDQMYSLLIIPDLAQNYMILNEAKLLNIPTLGLVNPGLDTTKHVVDYAIFGNDKSSYVVNFFCQLLARFIKKEIIHLKYKKEIVASCSLPHISKDKTNKNEVTKPSKKFLFFFLKITGKSKEFLSTGIRLERKEWDVEKSSRRKKSLLVVKYKNFLTPKHKNIFSRFIQQWLAIKLNIIKDFYKRENVEIGFFNTLAVISANSIVKKFLKTSDVVWLNNLKNKIKQLPKLYFEGQKFYGWTKITKPNNPFHFGNLVFWESFPTHNQDEYDKKTYDRIAKQDWKLLTYLKYMKSKFLVFLNKKYANRLIYNLWNEQFYIKLNANYNKRNRNYFAKHRFKYKDEKEQLKKEKMVFLRRTQYISKYGFSNLELKTFVKKSIIKC